MTEAELKRTVLDMAYAAGWLVYHVPATNVRGSQGRGYPDLTLARNGRVLWYELKQEKGKTFVEQATWGVNLPPDAWRVVRPSDIEDVREQLR